MAILQNIIEKHTPQVRCKCEEKKCNLNLKGYRKKVILKGEECVGNSCKMCDCLIFINEKNKLLIPIVELKSNSFKANEVVEKFYNGLEQCEEILSECSRDDITCKFILIFLAKSYKRTSEFTKIRDSEIKYKNKRYHIRCKNCGDALKDIIQL